MQSSARTVTRLDEVRHVECHVACRYQPDKGRYQQGRAHDCHGVTTRRDVCPSRGRVKKTKKIHALKRSVASLDGGLLSLHGTLSRFTDN